MAGFAVSAGLFILARPAGAAATPVAIAAIFLLARNPRERRRLAVPAAVLVLLAGCLDLALTPRSVRDGISYFSVFWELLPSSPDPAQDLRELGLDPALVAYSGTHPWSSNSLAQRPEALRSFNSRVSLASVGRLYVRHPRRLWQALERISKDLWRDRVLHGNFDRSAGLPMAARSHRFSAWSSLKERVLPRRPISWCLLFAAAGGAIAVMGSGPGTARRAGLCALLLAAAAIDVLIVAVIGWFSDSPRLLVPFHLSIDTLVLLFLTAPFTRERSAPSASPAAEGASMETSDNTR
jgi:hypothetical protein